MGLELRFTDKEITPWGGMALMKRMLDQMGLSSALSDIGLPAPGSNRAYSPEQLILQFMLGVWCGANRFEHGEITRHDKALQQIFGWSRMANFKAVMRLFNKFTQRRVDSVFGCWYAWLFERVCVEGLTLDLDSTVMTRYGTQQGAVRGYNPTKRGRASHHPLMAFVADTQMVANCWLRPGNTHSANNGSAFLADTLHRLGNNRVQLLRADSGFSDATFLEELESRRLHYIVALRMQQPLQRALINQRGWWRLEDGIELTSFDYQSTAWHRPRRVVAIRQHINLREKARGKTLSLFADDPTWGKYRYGVLVTDLDLPAQIIWRTYRGRADSENRIKELKYDFGADSFCLHDFYATEACLNVVMMAFNLMSLFRQTLLKTLPTPTLKTLRYKLFALPAYITHEGKRRFLKIALAMQRRNWFSGLWTQAATIDLPASFSPVFSP